MISLGCTLKIEPLVPRDATSKIALLLRSTNKPSHHPQKVTQPQPCQHCSGLLKSNYNLHFFDTLKLNLFVCLGHLWFFVFCECSMPAIDSMFVHSRFENLMLKVMVLGGAFGKGLLGPEGRAFMNGISALSKEAQRAL